METLLRRSVSLLVTGFVLAGCAQPQAVDEPAEPTEEELIALARGIHDRVVTIDTHDDIPFDFATEEVDPGVRGSRKVDLPKMREGGLDVGFFIVYVGQGDRDAAGYELAKEQAMTKFAAIHRMAEEMYPDEIELAHTADDVERIAASGKLVAAIGIENGWVIGQDLSLIEEYQKLGARYVTLAHNGNNDICDSANPRGDDPDNEHDGVSEFGVEVIAEMNRVGIMVDVSHISKKSMPDAARLSQAPVIASHSSTRALCDVSRNMDDEQLLALKENGGVMQTVALGDFVKVDPVRNEMVAGLREELGLRGGRGGRGRGPVAELSAAEQADREARQAQFDERLGAIDEEYPPANLEDFVNHIDHAVQLIGVDHVGISSDFDGGGGIPGWNDASETFNVTLELVRRGYSEQDVAKIWGGNLLRVWRETERVADELQAGS